MPEGRKKKVRLNLQEIFYHPYPAVGIPSHFFYFSVGIYLRYLLGFVYRKMSGRSSKKVLPASLPGHGSLVAFIISLTLHRCPSPRSWISLGGISVCPVKQSAAK